MGTFATLEALEQRQLLSSAPLIAKSRLVKEVEPNDDKAQATAFALHAPSGVAQLKGRFKNNDDRDYFTFTATRSGRMTVKVRGLGGTFAKFEIETAASADVFETEPNNGVNQGSFKIQSGVTYIIRIEKNNPGDHHRYITKLKLRQRDVAGA